jgi:hypothetical protein
VTAERPSGSPAHGPPPGLRCIDVHVHLHPERLASAIERHFAEQWNWIAAHSFDPDAVAATLRARGVERFCFFSYAHKPGMARSLNRWVAETAARFPDAIPFGTLHPGDPDLVDVAAKALDELGLAGFKFHHSVQRFSPDDPALLPVYGRAEASGARFVMHAGNAPYRDAHTGITRFRRLMERFPELRVCVAHMGAFEADAFLELTEEFPHLYLDTSMALTAHSARYMGFQPGSVSTAQLLHYQDRILFGSDFPLIPYDYEEERRWAWERGLPPDVLRKIFFENAARFLGLSDGVKRVG